MRKDSVLNSQVQVNHLNDSISFVYLKYEQHVLLKFVFYLLLRVLRLKCELLVNLSDSAEINYLKSIIVSIRIVKRRIRKIKTLQSMFIVYTRLC